ncbi:M48 family metallopeptidase [Aureimonas psammosilenae]|uniref:M48 family metallopeptidase n=1 Tax=Aureimonas psammosilenae TaxID=2495496 RepID=UPI0012611C6C|nr:SprT family zinc-dependent metalloprotease [Aureimonas psammosilenae]
MPLTKLLRASTRATPLPDAVEIAGRSVALSVRRHPRARRLTLRLQGEGLSVTAPMRVPNRAILEFVERHHDWAKTRLEAKAPGIRVGDGAVLPFRGGELHLRYDPARRTSAFEHRDGRLHLLVGGEPEHFARRAVDAVKKAARADLQAAVERHSAHVGLKPAALALKDTKSRWGSCTVARRLSFSWRIVMAPPFVLDYLAAHEVAHFREMNHGAGFWALCRELCPGMDEGRAWLKQNGASLHAVDFST